MPISINDSDCRFIKTHGVTFIEQNKKKGSKYATMALSGSKITWVVNGGRWGLIIDGAVNNNGTKLKLRPESISYNTSWDVQFPIDIREEGARYVVEELIPAVSGSYYRSKGTIKKLI